MVLPILLVLDSFGLLPHPSVFGPQSSFLSFRSLSPSVPQSSALFVLFVGVGDVVGAFDFLVVVLFVVVIHISIVNFDIDFDEVVDLFGFEYYSVEEVPVGLVDTHHTVGVAIGVLCFEQFLQIFAKIFVTCYYSFLCPVFLCHISVECFCNYTHIFEISKPILQIFFSFEDFG